MLVRFTMKFSPHRASGRPVRGQQQEVAAPRVVGLSALLLLLLLPSLAAALTLPGMDEEKVRHLPLIYLPVLAFTYISRCSPPPSLPSRPWPPAGILQARAGITRCQRSPIRAVLPPGCILCRPSLRRTLW